MGGGGQRWALGGACFWRGHGGTWGSGGVGEHVSGGGGVGWGGAFDLVGVRESGGGGVVWGSMYLVGVIFQGTTLHRLLIIPILLPQQKPRSLQLELSVLEVGYTTRTLNDRPRNFQQCTQPLPLKRGTLQPCSRHANPMLLVRANTPSKKMA